LKHPLGIPELALRAPDLALWTALIVGRLLVCLCIVKTKFFRRLPWFSVYIAVSTAENLMLLTIAFRGTYAAYYYTYYLAGYIELTLAFAALIELGRQVFPGLDLPRKREAVRWLLAAITAALVFASAWPLPFIENKIYLGACLVVGVGFIFVAVYARYLGLHWSRLVGGTGSALGLLYLAEAAAKATTGQFPLAYVVLRQISELVNILAVIAWTIVILMPWGEYDPTEEDLAQAKQIVDDIEDNLRHVAAGGRE
jgi:hypothetical protein